jgi:sulfite exporter TauE/SafE/copper chaperone CopZ
MPAIGPAGGLEVASRMSRHRSPSTTSASRRTGTRSAAEPLAEAANAAPAADDLHVLAVARRNARLSGQPVPVALGAPSATVAAVAASPTTIRTVVPVAGMTCRSCEVRINRYVGRLPGVERVSASAVHGRVEIESSAPLASSAIRGAISAAGYEVGRSPWVERDPVVWGTVGVGLVIVVAIAVALNVSGIGGLANSAGDLASGGLAVALLLGLAAGVSTCMAMVGGLVLALSASYTARLAATGEGVSGVATRLRPAAMFMVGRTAGYGMFGALLGAVGATLAPPPMVTAALMVAVAVLMTLLGVRLTGLSPRVAAWSPTLPMGLARRLGLADGQSGGYSDGRAAVLGAASFFMPCGFTQAVQVFALSTGSPLYAGALLAVFAVGTAPGLLALAGLPVVMPTGFRPTLLRVAGVAVLAFALVNATAGLRLAGVELPGAGGGSTSAAVAAGTTSAGTQALTTYQNADGYSPSTATIYSGEATTWTIESKSTASCASSIVVPLLNISKRLHLGQNTIELPALSAGTVYYSCSMGMFGGAISVVDRPSGPTGAATGG